QTDLPRCIQGEMIMGLRHTLKRLGQNLSRHLVGWKTGAPSCKAKLRRDFALELLEDRTLPSGGMAFPNSAIQFNATSPSDLNNQILVTRLYRDLLQRQPDAAGLANFSDLLDTGAATGAQVARAIENSPEYHQKAVEDLYTRLLGRTA